MVISIPTRGRSYLSIASDQMSATVTGISLDRGFRPGTPMLCWGKVYDRRHLKIYFGRNPQSRRPLAIFW